MTSSDDFRIAEVKNPVLVLIPGHGKNYTLIEEGEDAAFIYVKRQGSFEASALIVQEIVKVSSNWGCIRL